MSLNLLKTFNPQLYQLLDWELIISELCSKAHFDCTKELLSTPPSKKTLEQIDNEFDRVQYIIECGTDFIMECQKQISNLSSDAHLMDVIDMLPKGKVGTIPELHFIASIIELYQEFTRTFKTWRYLEEKKVEHRTIQLLQAHFLNPLRQFVDHNGNIDYYKHPLLRGLYAELSSLEKDLRFSISQVANSPTYSEALQFKEYDVINDRFVLAIRSDSYKTILGPIISKSSSGMTLFVEPPSLREKGNKRIQILAEIEEVTSRIARELSEILHEHCRDVVQIKNIIINVDKYLARADYIFEKDLNRPDLSYDFEIKLRGFFHPLIDNPVRNDIDLDIDNLGMIISGPNTGGKTVTLKVMALCQLFLHSGLYLPISSGRIMPVDGLFYFSSDNQNIEEGLSSFASETQSYLSLFDNFADSNLIIVDEIFNSTSSDEASALALAFLDEVHNFSNSKVLISTHHQLFKTIIHGNKKYVSAHVGHNAETFQPTYKIYTGEPGSSMAFHIFSGIAKKMNRDSSIAKRAEKILDGKMVSYDRLLQELSAKKSELDRLTAENRAINTDLKNQQKAAIGLAHLEKQKLVDAYRTKLEKKLSQANELVSKIKNFEITGQKTVRKMTAQLSSELNQLDPKKNTRQVDDNVIDEELKPEDIKVGVMYFSDFFSKNITVDAVNLRKKIVTGVIGKRSVQCPIASLRSLKNTPNKVKTEQTEFTVTRTVAGLIEIDGRGMRLDEFKSMVERSVFELINGDIPFLTIIHGHGTGILKNWTRDYLKTVSGISFSPDDGNDGSTRVERS